MFAFPVAARCDGLAAYLLMKTILSFILFVVPAAGAAAQAPKPAVAPTAVSAGIGAPLSATILEKIARMTPLFDGTTLDGWIQAPSAPVTFASSEIVQPRALIEQLTEKSDAVSAYVAAHLDAPAKAMLADYSADAEKTKTLASALARSLNALVAGPPVFEEARFRNVDLRPATETLRRRNPTGQDLMRLNRMLLEDAYPGILRTSPTSSWIVKDGAMASTGAGRGVIYTARDYSHYRLIFSLRHLATAPGQGDHQPCVLIFCARPPDDGNGPDALGGIQFQAPNGGHWDYRPGINKAGTGFTNPAKPRFANREWCQVEILVNANDGTARMAVAQKVGTRTVENLAFRDAAAGKPGPIAWQMHNAGLFDEFKDVRVEIDPPEDRLITTE